MKDLRIELTEQQAETIGSALLREMRQVRAAVECGADEAFPGDNQRRLNSLRGAYEALASAENIH